MKLDQKLKGTAPTRIRSIVQQLTPSESFESQVPLKDTCTSAEKVRQNQSQFRESLSQLNVIGS